MLQAWAQLETDTGRLQAAKALLQQALQADPDHVPSYMALGQLEWVLGSSATARKVGCRCCPHCCCCCALPPLLLLLRAAPRCALPCQPVCSPSCATFLCH